MNKITKRADNDSKLINRNILDNIDISDQKRKELAIEVLGEFCINKVPIIREVFGSINSYKDKLDHARLLILLKIFRDKYETMDKFQNNLKKLLLDPYGMYLFQKILAIVNACSIDTLYIKVLANVLKNISDSDFKKLFDEHDYVLAQIEKITPQAMLILAEADKWPMISFSSSMSSGVTTGEGWDKDFAKKYGQIRNITDHKIIARISHAVNDLKNNNIFELRATSFKLNPIGEEIFKYLK